MEHHSHSSPLMVLLSGALVLLNAVNPSNLVTYLTNIVLTLTAIKLIRDLFFNKNKKG